MNRSFFTKGLSHSAMVHCQESNLAYLWDRQKLAEMGTNMQENTYNRQEISRNRQEISKNRKENM